jgi:Zn ribbon nucleic-acid-binding protein
MTDRHYDNGCSLYSFRNVVLVECPQCSSCAQSSHIEDDRLSAITRVSCLRCGHGKDQKQQWFWTRSSRAPRRGRFQGRERDPHFGLPLWLQRPCCGETLWAYNFDHLAYMASYVGASLRLRNPENTLHCSNSSMASRFPRWMISAKNRAAVLRGIQMLREKSDP